MSGALAEALVGAQAKMPAVEKTETAKVKTKSGVEFSYSYASLDHLIALTRPVLNEHGLSIIQFPEGDEQGRPGLRTTITHTSGEKLSAWMPLVHAGGNMQELGSAITYARRYMWAAALGIAAEADDDAASAKPTQTRSAGLSQPVGGGVSEPAGNGSSSQPAPPPSSFQVPEKAREGALGFEESSAANVPQEQRNREAASRVKVHFGKNVDKTLAELTQKQVAWYAGDGWLETTAKALEEGKKQKVTSKDLQLRQAARCYLAVEPVFETVGAFAPDADVPF